MAAKTSTSLSKFADYTDTDTRVVWAAMASLATPAALRGEGDDAGDTFWLLDVENALVADQLANPRNATLSVHPWGFEVAWHDTSTVERFFDPEAPVPEDPNDVPAHVDAESFTGTLRGVLLDTGKAAPDVWLVETDDGVWRTIMDNTGMGIGAECLVTGCEGFWAWMAPETGPTVVGSKVTFRRTGGAS